jgi:hypothetical protein
MPFRQARLNFRFLHVLCFVLSAWMLAGGQTNAPAQNPTNTKSIAPKPQTRPQPPAPGSEYSGMYSFLREGEFVQITVEDHGHVTGFVSRYGDSDTDHDVFLDHFFKSGQLDGNQLTFTTDTVHGISFEFRGTFMRGSGKMSGDEAYYELKGTLVDNVVDEPIRDDLKKGDAKKDIPKKDVAKSEAPQKISARSRDIVMKSFPQDVGQPQSQK